MPEFHGIVAGEEFGQIPRKRQSCHFRPVTVGVVGPPPGFDGVQIAGGERGRKQWMTPIDPRVEKADVRHCAVAGRVSGSSQQIVEPFGLLFRR